ncbi:uncharacterized protein LOC116169214 [Photinus pyralis]|uniref:uncharacterized protein LOC116169214 n=1 Tax=Photinus pyralis TaxID=7054 RepID=UPI001266F4FF|nr:uncharacterized protein LOC116169214 [Photinus pyralis]
MQLNNSASQSSSTHQVKLPTIHLPTFEGAFDQWIKFHDTFQSVIHNNESITSIQKFQYLKGCLTGTASETIKSLPISASNYEVAWERLCKRFHNKKLIVENHLKALFGLGQVKKNSHVSLRDHLDKLLNNVQALGVLAHPTLDDMLVYIAVSKLDSFTREKWEEATVNIDFPTFEQLTEFMQERCKILESRTIKEPINQSNISRDQGNTKRVDRGTPQKSKISFTAVHPSCSQCQGEHYLSNCDQFTRLPVEERFNIVTRSKLCINCLRPNHLARFCRSSRCKRCNGKHHTTLHNHDHTSAVEKVRSTQPAGNISATAATHTQEHEIESYLSHSEKVFLVRCNEVLLSTAVVDVENAQGKYESCRILLDSAAQSNFITERFAEMLRLKREDVHIPIVGIGNCNTKVNQRVSTIMKSRTTEYKIKISFLVIPNITSRLPSVDFSARIISIPDNIILADPHFSQARPVDALLGAEIFWELICIGQINVASHSKLRLQKTLLGWVISGQVPLRITNDRTAHVVRACCATTDLNLKIQRKDPIWSPDEKFCEIHFSQETRRGIDGKFIVSFPFKSSIQNLGDSRSMAQGRFMALERRLQRQTSLKDQYEEFMQEYINLGHMSEVSETTTKKSIFFLTIR